VIVYLTSPAPRQAKLRVALALPTRATMTLPQPTLELYRSTLPKFEVTA
jgi:hypothetical protein